MAFLGYPNLLETSFYLSEESISLLDSDNRLFYPERCCLCDKREIKSVEIVSKSGIFGWRKQSVIALPFCIEHESNKHPNILVHTLRLNPRIALTQVISENNEFSEQLKNLNSSKVCLPPWEAFPELGCDSSAWRQGDTAQWYHEAWTPYWNSLSPIERSQILDEYSTNSDWRDKLSNASKDHRNNS